jgi:glycosyltransferase involved in cell wall biosynthesis
MRFSVVVPAHNEEVLLPTGLRAIAAAAEQIDGDVEVIVVANRCTDATATLSRGAGATVVDDESRNISTVRNAGAAVASGDVLVTIDADCVMSPRTLVEIDRLVGTVTGRRFTNIRTAPIVASCRKFDRFGDWHMFGMALQLREIRAAMNGSGTAWVDRYFFDFND